MAILIKKAQKGGKSTGAIADTKKAKVSDDYFEREKAYIAQTKKEIDDRINNPISGMHLSNAQIVEQANLNAEYVHPSDYYLYKIKYIGDHDDETVPLSYEDRRRIMHVMKYQNAHNPIYPLFSKIINIK